jgi:hypothetical protein
MRVGGGFGWGSGFTEHTYRVLRSHKGNMGVTQGMGSHVWKEAQSLTQEHITLRTHSVVFTIE